MKEKLTKFKASLNYEDKRELVGVQFIFTENEYKNINVPEANHQLFFCMMVKVAASGKCIKVNKNHLYCDAASKVLGFDAVDNNTLSGETFYKRNFYCSQEISKSVVEEIPYLKHNVYGMLIQPLEHFDTPPHIVISISSPYTAMRIIQGYTYKFGYAKNIRLAGMGGLCTELTARPYLTQDINISLLCSNSRFSGSWNDSEMGIGMPYNMFLEVLDGVLETMDLFEPDYKKLDIQKRAEDLGTSLDITLDHNYFDSCLGVANIGVKGYHKKKI